VVWGGKKGQEKSFKKSSCGKKLAPENDETFGTGFTLYRENFIERTDHGAA